MITNQSPSTSQFIKFSAPQFLTDVVNKDSSSAKKIIREPNCSSFRWTDNLIKLLLNLRLGKERLAKKLSCGEKLPLRFLILQDVR